VLINASMVTALVFMQAKQNLSTSTFEPKNIEHEVT